MRFQKRTPVIPITAGDLLTGNPLAVGHLLYNQHNLARQLATSGQFFYFF